MTKMRVKEGCELMYPDGGPRGIAGYIVDWNRNVERSACEGQEDSMEPCGDFHSADPVDPSRRAEPVAAPKPKAKKKAKKSAAKK